MSTVIETSRPRLARGPAGIFAELEAREPTLAITSLLFLLAVGPIALAALVDDQTVNGVDIWLKPVKFLVSLSLYYATLAWLQGYFPRSVRHSRLGRTLVTVPVVAGVLEMVWLVTTAALGQPSHFNRSAPVYEISYALAGVGATILMLVVLATGTVVARAREVELAPPLRLGIALGCGLAFVGTMVTAGYLASGTGHWVGGAATDASGLPLLGWSRSGGDLRVAHFFSMHALQIVPLAGWLVARSRLSRPRLAVAVFAAAYAGFVLWTFLQALAGRPFV
jgi:hypothetical protein